MSESRHDVGISQKPQQGTAEFVVPFAGGKLSPLYELCKSNNGATFRIKVV